MRRAPAARLGWFVVVLATLTMRALPAAVGVVPAPGADLQPELRDLLSKVFHFSAPDLTDLEKGKVVARRIGAGLPGEVAVAGAVRVNVPKETLVARYRDIVRFKQSADVLAIGRFGDPPSVADLATMTTGKQDVDLRACQVGDCDIRLPAAAIARFRKEIDWTAPDADARAANLFKEILAESVRAYATGGPGFITEYDDEKEPVRPADDFESLLKRSAFLEMLAPGLPAHLQNFPTAPLPGAEDILYWSKEKFGSLTPFISVTHIAIAHPQPQTCVLVSRDVYSSRYFDASLSVTVASDTVTSANAFYLVYINRSRAQALKGAFAGLRRTIVERRARGSLEENLKVTKARLEAPPK
jgi:hypothetical protein